MTYAYLGSADLSDMVEMEMGRVVVICSQSTEILYIKTWDFFFIMSKFCSVLCDEVHCEYWNYQIWFYSDVNSFFWFSICSDKIVHELLQKPSKKFLHKVNILIRNHVLVFLFKKKKKALGCLCEYFLCKSVREQRLCCGLASSGVQGDNIESVMTCG